MNMTPPEPRKSSTCERPFLFALVVTALVAVVVSLARRDSQSLGQGPPDFAFVGDSDLGTPDIAALRTEFRIPEIQAEFPVGAGMTVAEIDAFTAGQDSLAHEPDLETGYNFGWEKRDIEDGNGWLYYWVNGKHLLHCEIPIRDGRAESVWVMPGNAEWVIPVFFRLSGSGPYYKIDTSVDPSRIESDREMIEFARPLRLDRLALGSGNITDRGMAELGRFENAEIVSIGFASISGTSLRNLQSLKKLRELHLAKMTYSNDDLRHIASITSIQRLFLSRNKAITDDALRHLTRLPLRSLDLSGTSITSAGVKQLVQFHHLTELSLSECKAVDDRAIEDLSTMKQLKGLDLLFSGISTEGCRTLRARLPGCRVIFFDPPSSVAIRRPPGVFADGQDQPDRTSR